MDWGQVGTSALMGLPFVLLFAWNARRLRLKRQRQHERGYQPGDR